MEIPVCALCRNPLGAGMKITVWPTRTYAEFLAATERSPLEDYENPVVTCIPCAMQVRAALVASRAQ